MVTIEEQLERMSIPAPKLPRTPRAIPIFGRDAATRIQAITEKYQLRGDTSLGVALAKMYFDRQELWLPHSRAKALKRAAAKINLATKKYMSVLAKDATFAQLLSSAPAPKDDSSLTIGDINTLRTLRGLLRRLLVNSAVARQATSARGRGKDSLAVTVSAELGLLYDKCCPPSAVERAPTRTRTVSAPRCRPAPTKHRCAPSSGRLEGESHSSIRACFVREAAAMLGVRLTEESILTYRQKKHLRRVLS